MEEELKCPVCHCLFRNPVMLPCNHNVCYQCAENLIMKSTCANTQLPQNYTFKQTTKPTGNDVDKMSLISEAVLSDSDSGYSGGSMGPGETPSPPVLGSNVSAMVASLQGGKTNPTITPPSPPQNGITLPPLPESVSCLTCPICHRTLFLDERGAKSLDCNAMLKSIVDRYHNCDGREAESTVSTSLNNNLAANLCQLCPSTDATQKAVVKCVQCAVFYCASCREKCHPARGPLAQHKLIDASMDCKVTSSRPDVEKPSRAYPGLPSKPLLKNGIRLTPCPIHPSESTSLHCETCRLSLCVQCNEDGKHKSHEVKAIGGLYKAQKGQLSQQMGALSNKARQAKDLVMMLRGTQDEIQKNSGDLEAKTVAQCDQLIEGIQRKKNELLQRISREKELKSKSVREQTQQCTLKLRQTTGLLEYCIEVMKNNDAAAFLQTSQSLIERVACTERQWTSRHLVPKVISQFDLELQTSSLAAAIDKTDFLQIKVPDKPSIRVEEKSSKNNTVTLSWLVSSKRAVDGFKLEMDDGNNGPFREVYCGGESMCTVDGLHFNSVYRARVRAYNKAGSSLYSEVLHLQTSEVASFQLDPKQSHPDIKLSNNNSTVTSQSFESRIALGKIGFSRGIHYWEFSIDRFENNPDPAFGVARSDVDKASMLGKDLKSWTMYADESRNWILHNNQHFKRTDTGVKLGSRIGILLDVARGVITFFIDGKIQGAQLPLGPQTKTSSPILYYPAVSLNQNVQVTLHTGLKSPISSHPDPQFRKRIHSAPDSDLPPRRSPSMPQFKTQHSHDGLTSTKHSRGPPPAPPLRRGGSSGNVSIKSDGEISTASDPVQERSFKSFFRKR
uniref:E3 ubiquitin-protein ligase TRIM9 n=1 Tax=Phallusia mammillata TaxID=59560 RepID=A0A6F9DUW8_9ASCI|nr:E3 ubiquitin-protein ligase TRIM9 [Phallusia mammillata]